MRQILMIMAAMLLTCCSKESDVKAQGTDDMGKTLVVYYSYTGNCKDIVTELTKQITADVLEIEPAEKGLKYEANNYALGTQLLNAIKANPDDADSYPAIDPVNVSLDGYKNVIIVTPLWWSQMAAIMQTYLFNNKTQMAGKTVAMIVSSYSSGISGVVNDAKRLIPDVTWAGDALWINNSNRSNSSTLIKDWLGKQTFAKESSETRVSAVTADGGETVAYTLQGTMAQAGQRGIVIEDGKKIIR